VSFTIVGNGVRVGATFHVVIPKVPVDVYVSSIPNTAGCCSGSTPVFSANAGCQAACQQSLGDHLSFTFYLAMSAIAVPTFWPNGTITMDVPNTTFVTTFTPSDLGLVTSCSLNAYTALLYNLVNNYVQPWGDTIRDQVQVQFVQAVQAYAEALTLPRQYNLTSSMLIDMRVTGAQFLQAQVLSGARAAACVLADPAATRSRRLF
jgi:hypothetical protein